MNLDINEHFFTLSGEAPLPGHPMYLIRFAGCNLHCSYCDTKYHTEVSEKYSDTELHSLIASVHEQYPAAFILFTGGEPLLNGRNRFFSDTAKHFSNIQFYVETNGSILIDDTTPSNLHFVADWKTGSSNHADSFNKENLERLQPGRDCIKIVISRSDLNELPAILSEIRHVSNIQVYLSPQWGAIELEKLAAYIIDNRIDAALSLQLHKIIWGEKRGV